MGDVRVDEYYDEYWQRDAPPPASDPLSARRVEELTRALGETSARSVLEVGCGLGDAVAELARAGYRATGMDVSPRAVELARAKHPGCRFLYHSAEALPWPVEPGSIDVVFAFEVIEHLLRPRRLLEGAAQALAPGGYVALSTPYHGRVKNAALALRGFDRHFDVEGDHLRFFSDRALHSLLASTQFEVVRTSHLGRWWPVWANTFVWARRR